MSTELIFIVMGFVINGLAIAVVYLKNRKQVTREELKDRIVHRDKGGNITRLLHFELNIVGGHHPLIQLIHHDQLCLLQNLAQPKCCHPIRISSHPYSSTLGERLGNLAVLPPLSTQGILQ